MKLTYAGNVIGDDSLGRFVSGYDPAFEVATETVDGIQTGRQRCFLRLNQARPISFVVQWELGSVAQTLELLHRHPENLVRDARLEGRGAALLVVEHGGFVWHCEGAVMRECKPEHLGGVRAQFSFLFHSQRITLVTAEDGDTIRDVVFGSDDVATGVYFGGVPEFGEDGWDEISDE